jgi:hypothetical protein
MTWRWVPLALSNYTPVLRSMPVPAISDLMEPPLVCITFSEELVPYLLGLLELYRWPDKLSGTTEQINVALGIFQDLMAALMEGNCTPMITNMRVNGCDLEVQYNDVETWIVVGDLTDCAVPGPQGEKGYPGDTGATGAQGPQGIQGPQGETGAQGPQGDTGDTGATGAQGPQGIQGVQGIQGIQGEQGEKGDKGDTGSASDPGYPPETENTDDEDSCNLASYFAHEIIKKVLGGLLTSWQNQDSVVDAFASAIGNVPALGACGVGLVASVVNSFYTFVANHQESAIQDALDSSALWSDIACAIYCTITPDRTITDDNFSGVVSAIGDVTYSPVQDIVALIVDNINTLGAANCRQLATVGVYAVYDCSGCDCPSGNDVLITYLTDSYPSTGLGGSGPSHCGYGQTITVVGGSGQALQNHTVYYLGISLSPCANIQITDFGGYSPFNVDPWNFPFTYKDCNNTSYGNPVNSGNYAPVLNTVYQVLEVRFQSLTPITGMQLLITEVV